MNTLTTDLSVTTACVGKKPIFKSTRFEKGTRYYTVILDKDLFDDWVITIANGRIGTKLGRVRKIAFTCFDDALGQFENTTKTRIKRGYQLASYKAYQVELTFYK